jgi:hypothetical protein
MVSAFASEIPRSIRLPIPFSPHFADCVWNRIGILPRGS